MAKAAVCAAAMSVAWAGESGAVTFQNKSQYDAQLAAPLYTGVGRLVVDLGFTTLHACTGSLVSSNVVLTAAHCMYSGISFELPATGNSGALQQRQIFRSSNTLVLPSYLNDGTMSDLALFTIDTPVYGREIYELYTDKDELGQVITAVGGGLSGLMSEGNSSGLSDYRLRYGKNRYDLLGTSLGFSEDYIMMDNDNGTAENDVFGRFFGINDTGVRENGEVVDVGIIFGDSGGPDLIGRKIAGVHSFAGSGSFIQYGNGDVCGVPQAVDPVRAAPGNICTDGSWGDFGGSVRVSYYQSQIRNYIAAAAVPEPATWAMMLAGFGVVGGAMRRNRRTAAIA